MSDMCHMLSMFAAQHSEALSRWYIVNDDCKKEAYMTNGVTSTHLLVYEGIFNASCVMSLLCTVIGDLES